MSHNHHKNGSWQHHERNVNDDDTGASNDDDSTPTSSSSDGDDYSTTRNAESKFKSAFGDMIRKKMAIVQKVIGTRDPKDEEVVELLDPQDDVHDEDINIPCYPKLLTAYERKLLEKLTEKKFNVTEDKYDAGVDIHMSKKNEDKLWRSKNAVSPLGKKISKSVPTKMTSENLSNRPEKRTSQWEELMRKFSEAHKEECKTVSLDIPRAPRSTKRFPTGSQYEGTWDILGMSGFGTYTFPNGVVYVGEFDDGMFHGRGELRYPDGATLRGFWNKGQMTERTLIFADGLEYSETDWKYCRMPDRRFTIEYEMGLQPAGKTYLTANQPTRAIPPGFYDTGDGFYDPITKIVYSADDITAIVRSPSAREQKWIEENCRTSQDGTPGPRPDLYEQWSEPQVSPAPTPPPSAGTRSHPKNSSADGHDLAIPKEQKYRTCPDESESSSGCTFSRM